MEVSNQISTGPFPDLNSCWVTKDRIDLRQMNLNIPY